MKLKISGDRRIVDIVEEFQNSFPYLNLNFFGPTNGQLPGSPRPRPVPLYKQLKEIHPKVPEGFIDISSLVSVKELEQAFNQEFNLNVQVQRRSGSIWLETTVTDSWTLEHQNKHGKEITKNLEPESSDDSL